MQLSLGDNCSGFLRHLVQKAEVKGQSVHQEVYRVEEVEEIFQGDAAFPVVQVDRDEGQGRRGLPTGGLRQETRVQRNF